MDINNLREREVAETMSVTDLNVYIKNFFKSNRTLSAITVSGEISNFITAVIFIFLLRMTHLR